MIIQKIPVFCKHRWAHGRFNVNHPQMAGVVQQIEGYFCNLCQTLWKTTKENGLITKVGMEPKVEVGFIEQERKGAEEILSENK